MQDFMVKAVMVSKAIFQLPSAVYRYHQTCSKLSPLSILCSSPCLWIAGCVLETTLGAGRVAPSFRDHLLAFLLRAQVRSRNIPVALATHSTSLPRLPQVQRSFRHMKCFTELLQELTESSFLQITILTAAQKSLRLSLCAQVIHSCQ